MPKLNSLEDLRRLRARIVDEDAAKPTVVVCAGTACQASESSRLIRAVKKYILMNDLVDRVALRVTGCHGFCEMGPFLITEPQRAFYTKLEHYQVPRIIEAMLEDRYVEELLYQDPATGERYHDHDNIPFFNKQQRTLLAQNQRIDPIRLLDAIAEGAYLAVDKALNQKNPEWIIDEIKRAGLRGRGGAGFPAGTKWELASRQDGSDGKYVVCNADEGDPGAYMDRSILEGNPHSVIEGMIIGGIAMGATEGFIFVRHEYPQAIKNSLIGLRSARDYGLLGDNILGSGFNFDISIVKSAGAFVCGEETALIKTIEGKMGEPRQRPPYPIEKGIYGRPTCINNVETWANVPVIIARGADAYAAVGTKGSTGTKVFSLVGKIRNTGLVEVPMGIPIKEIVYEIGGGPLDNSSIKAVQIGGPSGGCIPHWQLDLPIDYDSLKAAGAIMGSGGMIVMDDHTCMVDVAKYFMGFLKDESCGKCFTCRKGTQRMWEILDDITRGHGTMDQLDLLEELAKAVQDTTMCGLGQSAPNPVLSTLRNFRHEYERHIIDKRCDALVCKDLVGAPCQAACPVGTEVWRYIALVGGGEYEEAYRAIREHNPLPSVCARVCDHKCEFHCKLTAAGEDPIAARAIKRLVTDRVDPSIFEPQRSAVPGASDKRIAIIGAGPAGLAAAHELSLMGYKSVIYEADSEPGGMLRSGIPAYRLPRETLAKEIDALIDDNVTLECGRALGQDLTIDGLLDDGFAAVLLAIGAHTSRPLGLDGDEAAGVISSVEFLKAWNLEGDNMARGRVGIIGGGNSAIDAARVARRQPGVDSVTVFYRRTRHEMPAFAEEIEAAVAEGIELETLVSPIGVRADDGQLAAITFQRNRLGDFDTSGRRRPVPEDDSEVDIPLDTLIVAIGEKVTHIVPTAIAGINREKWGGITTASDTTTSRANVFAAGDAVTGPNTVINAIAAGQRVAHTIDRHLRGLPLQAPPESILPRTYVEPIDTDNRDDERPREQLLPQDRRVSSFEEVELGISPKAAEREAKRCLRCDLEFTRVELSKRASGGDS